jgi:WD40 repeat protein
MGQYLRSCAGDRCSICSLAFSPDGALLASGCQDRTVRFWDPHTRRQLGRCERYNRRVTDIAFSPDGKTLAVGGDDGTVRLWDVAAVRSAGTRLARTALATKERAVSARPRGLAQKMILTPDGRTVLSGGVEGIHAWDAATGRCLRRLGGDIEDVAALTLCADGRAVAAIPRGDDRVFLLQVGTGKEVGRLDFGFGTTLVEAAFAPDGRTLASVSWGLSDSAVRLWDLASGKELRRIPSLHGGVYRVAYSPDGKILAVADMVSGREFPVRLLDIQTGEKRCRLETKEQARDMAFSPDGNLFAWAGVVNELRPEGNGVRLWEVATGKELPPLQSDIALGSALAFTHDGRTLATGGSGKHVCLFELATGRERARLDADTDDPVSLSYARDGRRLLCCHRDGTGLVWDITGSPRGGALPAVELRARWRELAGEDAYQAWQAVWALANSPCEAVPFLRERLPPVPVAGRQKVARWIADLDADDFSTRELATAALAACWEEAAPALREVLQGQPTPEVRRRAQRLVGDMALPSPERLRLVRAVEALEYAATPAAAKLLEELAQGAPQARLTREAKDALQRLSRRPR